ncbi:MAG: hypothetical protein AAGF12_32820 [Myxococcota bacterium]
MKSLLLYLAGCILLASNPVHAQSEDERARAHFEAGQAHAAVGRCEAANREFAQGYELSGRPAFLFNMAECARHDGQTQAAQELYRRYLTEDPDGPLASLARERLDGPQASIAPPQPTAVIAESEEPRHAEPILSPNPREVSTQPGSLVHEPFDAPSSDDSVLVVERWWFWAIVGLVAVGTATTVVLATQLDGPSQCRAGCLDLR